MKALRGGIHFLFLLRAGLDSSQPPSTSTPMPYHYPDYDSYSDNDDFIGLLYPEEGRGDVKVGSLLFSEIF